LLLAQSEISGCQPISRQGKELQLKKAVQLVLFLCCSLTQLDLVVVSKH